MPDGERSASALSPEEIGERASAILRSVEGLRAADAASILAFAQGVLPRRSVDDEVVRFAAKVGGR
jgi:hypothetical protein